MIIGSKKSFAIEWSENARVSPVRLWVENKFIGTLEDSQSLAIMSHQLEGLVKRVEKLSFTREKGESNQKIFDRLLSEGSGSHLVSLGDTFDDFCILAYMQGNNLCLVWRLESDPFFTYLDYTKGVVIGTIPAVEFEDVLGGYQDAITPL